MCLSQAEAAAAEEARKARLLKQQQQQALKAARQAARHAATGKQQHKQHGRQHVSRRSAFALCSLCLGVLGAAARRRVMCVAALWWCLQDGDHDMGDGTEAGTEGEEAHTGGDDEEDDGQVYCICKVRPGGLPAACSPRDARTCRVRPVWRAVGRVARAAAAAQKRYSDDQAGEMVACDRCDNWFHFACVGITQAQVRCRWLRNPHLASGAPSPPLRPPGERAVRSTTSHHAQVDKLDKWYCPDCSVHAEEEKQQRKQLQKQVRAR